MNLKRIPILVLLSLILVSCDSGATSESVESSDSIESIESVETTESTESVESSESTESEESTESIESEEPFNAEEVLENRATFKTYFESWTQENAISSFSYSMDDTKSYKKGSSEGVVTINANEVIHDVEFVGEIETNSYTEVTYIGLFEKDNLFYNVKNNSLNPNAKRYLISEEDNGIYKNVINSESANRQLNNNIRNLGASYIANTLGWSTYLSGTMNVTDIGWSYDYDDETSLYTIYGDSVVSSSLNVTVNNFVASLDLNGNIVSGKLDTTIYNAGDFDLELNIPNDGAIEVSHKNSFVSEIKYLKKEVKETPTYEGLDTLFIQEILSYQYVQTFFSTTHGDIINEPNKVFANSVIELNNDNMEFLPTTAIDMSSIVITNSSNEDAIYFDSYGNWSSTGLVGEKTTLTLGNESNPNLFELEIEVNANPYGSSDSSDPKDI